MRVILLQDYYLLLMSNLALHQALCVCVCTRACVCVHACVRVFNGTFDGTHPKHARTNTWTHARN